MLTGKTKAGFEWSIKDEARDDWDTFELLADAEEGKISSLRQAYKKLLGEEQFKALKDFYRDKEGHLSFTLMYSVMNEEILNDEDSKNSESSQA